MINYIEMWQQSKVVTPELFLKYQEIINTQAKNHTAKLSKEQQSFIKESLLESILKYKSINLALLDPFDNTYISGVVVQMNEKDISILYNSTTIKIPIHLIIGFCKIIFN